MTEGEFEAVLAVWAAVWPKSQLPAPGMERDTWRRLWGDLTAQQAVAAIEALARDGDRFPPPPGLVCRKAADLAVDDAPWAEVWAEILHMATSHGIPRDDTGAPMDPGVLPWSRPEILELVRLVTWTAICAYDGETTILEAQCRGKWNELTARRAEDRRLAPMAADLPRIAGARSRVGGMTRLAIEAP